jgi:tetratricopeptide (TPR) repeat protein
VKPKDGFHLSDLADFAVAQRSAPATVEDDTAPAGEADDTFETLDTAESAPSPASVAHEPEPAAAAAQTVPDAPGGAAARGWRLRDDDADQAHDLTSDTDSEDSRFETDPEVVEARLEINDRLRRRRCDEAAALLQRLANDVGGRALAELALDAGDRCRALGKGNAALSCYLAASRADPVHETPLLRLADICIDDHDIDLAVSYLERVTRLRRLRNDDKGALKLYRKIVTIAPYRDDILAMLMRAQANGRFDE